MDDIDRSLARAVLARTLKDGLSFPTRRTLRAFRNEGRKALRRAAVPEPGAGSAGAALVEAAERLCAVRAASPEGLRDEYESLFGHALRGRVCPYETEYAGGALFQHAQELADISGFYRAFGLEAAWANGERVDHAACEFEFLEFLSMKEAWALEPRDAEMLEVTRRAARGFLRDHLARFGVAFGTSLRREGRDGFYGRLGALCTAFLRSECARLGLRTGPELLELRPEVEDPVPMACGGEENRGPELQEIRSRRWDG